MKLRRDLALTGSTEDSRLRVDSLRVFQYRLNFLPGITFEPVEEAGAPTGMAGNAAGLRDLEQHHITVAIGTDFEHFLRVAGFFTLEPQLATRS